MDDQTAQAAMDSDLNFDKVTLAYVHMRDARTALAADFKKNDDALKAKQRVLEGVMLDFLNRHHLDSAPTTSGVFYKQEEVTPTGSDWSAFYDWIKEHDAFDALEKRIKKTFIKEYMDTNEGALPPGVSVFREFIVRVRRS